MDVLENKDRSGIAAGASDIATKRMTLNLANIRYNVSQMKTKRKGIFSSQQVPRPPEEIFMMSQLAPATHSHYITNDYVLNVNVKFDGCTCCAALPNISVPLSVIPMTDAASYGFQEPPGYQPFELGFFRFDL